MTWAEGNLDALSLRAELVSGQQFHAGGGTVDLSAQEWLDRWRHLRQTDSAGADGLAPLLTTHQPLKKRATRANSPVNRRLRRHRLAI